MPKAALKYWSIFIVFPLLLIGIVVYLFVFSTPPDHVIVANMGANSFSVGWRSTSGPKKGCAIAIADTSDSVLWERVQSFFVKNYDGRYIVKRCAETSGVLQLIFVNNLFDDTVYKVHVTSGVWNVAPINSADSLVSTAKIISDQSPPNPEPAYGSVVNARGDAYTGALIYLYLKEGLAYPLATVTNAEGNYALDLANFLVQDSVEQLPSEGYKMQIMDDRGRVNESDLASDPHQPFAAILLEYDY